MKKFNELNKKLQTLESQKQKLNSLNNISIPQFIKYKSIILQQTKVSKRMEKMVTLGNKINFWYNESTHSWIKNPKINNRKYFKLEKRASYKKDITLYKLGLSNQRPTYPLIQSLNYIFAPVHKRFKEILQHFKFVFHKIKFSKFNLFRKISKKYNHFTSKILPQKINKLAIKTAIVGIKGYKMFKSDCRYIRSLINSKDSIKYFKSIINTANVQVSQAESGKNFRENLKVNYSFTNSNNTVSNYQKLSKKNISKKKINSTAFNNYEHTL